MADAAALTASLFGVPLIYELYQPEGEAEAGIPIPVGHETAYTANLRAKLEMAPNSPDGDGDYVVRQTNGRNEYVPATYPVADVQVNGAGVVTDGVANIVTDPVVAVSGTTPTISAVAGTRYVCGEVATLGITVPASGIIDVVFTSGSTPTVLTVTPPTGMTILWANGFDPTSLNANTTYEINVMDGVYGVVGTWT